MKKILSLILLLTAVIGYGQNVGIGTSQPKSKLHVAGSLRVDSLANSKSRGVVLHNSSGEVYSLPLTGNATDVLRGDGTFASPAATTNPSWLTLGNAGIDTAVNFLGTLDSKALIFRVNNIRAGIIAPVGGNISLGLRSLQKNKLNGQGGYSNIAIGTDALRNNTVGKRTIAIGDSALFTQPGNTSGGLDDEDNIAIGSKALYSNVTGHGNLAVGIEALTKNTSEENTAVGFQALSYNTTGGANTAVGNIALRYNTNGYSNTAVGYSAVTLGGRENTGVGLNAMQGLTGVGNTAVGSWSEFGAPLPLGGSTATGNYNTAVGYFAHSLTNVPSAGNNVPVGNYNSCLGAYSLFENEAGYNNTAIGSYSLYSNTSAYNNTAVGYQSLYFTTTGRANVADGYQSLYNTTTGIWNTAIGTLSMLGNKTGSYNTGLGFGADVTSANLSNATAVGYNAKVDASNKVRIGNAAVTKIEGQVPFTVPSDGRFKFNIKQDVVGLDFILRLRPVTYQFDVKRFDHFNGTDNTGYDKAAEIKRTGFIAQEVERAANDAGYDFSGVVKPESDKDHYSLSYDSFVVPLVKAIQEQQALIVSMRAEIDRLKKQLH